MIGIIVAMNDYYAQFEKILKEIKRLKIPEIEKSLQAVYSGLQVCGKKMTSAAKFIDYFVHDILDYTLLNREDSNFSKDISVFGVDEAI